MRVVEQLVQNLFAGKSRIKASSAKLLLTFKLHSYTEGTVFRRFLCHKGSFGSVTNTSFQPVTNHTMAGLSLPRPILDEKGVPYFGGKREQ